MIEEKEEDKVDALEIVELVEGETTRMTKIGTALGPEMRVRLVQFLKENLDVFAWSHKDLPSISPEVIQYRLNVNLEKKPDQQRRRVSTLERNQAITNEVNKVLSAEKSTTQTGLPMSS